MLYIFRCLFYKPIVTKLVISNCVKVRCWQKNTGHRQQILLVVIHSSFFGVQPDTVCTVAGVNWQLCLIVLFTFRAFKFDARVHIKQQHWCADKCLLPITHCQKVKASHLSAAASQCSLLFGNRGMRLVRIHGVLCRYREF